MQDFIDQLKQAVDNSTSSGIGPIIMALMLTILRILGDNKVKKLTRIFIELPTAGLLVVVSNSMISSFGLDPSWSLFVAAMIGHQGTNWVKDVSRRFTERMLEKENGRHK